MLRRVRRMRDLRFVSKLICVFATLALRGIYFRQMTFRTWLRITRDFRHSFREVFSWNSFVQKQSTMISGNAVVSNGSPRTMMSSLAGKGVQGIGRLCFAGTPPGRAPGVARVCARLVRLEPRAEAGIGYNADFSVGLKSWR